MNTFLIGFLTAIFIVFVVGVVVGVVLSFKNRKRLDDLNMVIEELYRSIGEQDTRLKIELVSLMDSRINKLENKIS